MLYLECVKGGHSLICWPGVPKNRPVFFSPHPLFFSAKPQHFCIMLRMRRGEDVFEIRGTKNQGQTRIHLLQYFRPTV
uniref:Uncharacterized protein n=1 Tax=Anguilla anguilla TaxID=7936 RepID=A0A0E9X5Z0_ANGAN